MTGGERMMRALGDNASLTKTVAEKDGKVTKKAGKWLAIGHESSSSSQFLGSI